MTRYEQGFMRKCAEYGVDAGTAMGLIHKKAEDGLSREELIRRRQKINKIRSSLLMALMGGYIGGGIGAVTSSAKNDAAPSAKGILLGALLGAAGGGAAGWGGAALHNAISDYVGVDPLLPTVGVEQARSMPR